MGRIWRSRHWFPVTPLGLGVALLGFWVSYIYGSEELDYVLHTGGLVAVGMVGLTTLMVLLASLRIGLAIRRVRGGEELELETGLTASTGLELPSLERWPLVQLRVVWEEPTEVEVDLRRRVGGWSEELIRPCSRGESTRIARRFLVEDSFGFARFGVARALVEQRLRIMPARAKVTAHVVARFLGGDALSWPTGPAEGEPLEMRRYVYGDPLRHVLWKAFARTRKLLVRTPERAITPRPSSVAYLVSGPGDEAMAGAARFFIEEGLLGKDFVFCADGAASLAHSLEEATDQIIHSARFRDRGGEGLGSFVRQLSPQQLEACVLFVPPVDGPWLRRVEQISERVIGGRVITAVDDHLQPIKTSAVHRLLFSHTDKHLLSARRLGRVVRRLSGCGLQVHVIHRPTGELMAPAQLDALAGWTRA